MNTLIMSGHDVMFTDAQIEAIRQFSTTATAFLPEGIKVLRVAKQSIDEAAARMAEFAIATARENV